MSRWRQIGGEAGPGMNDAHSGTWWSGLVLHQSILGGLDVYPGGRQELGVPLPEPCWEGGQEGPHCSCPGVDPTGPVVKPLFIQSKVLSPHPVCWRGDAVKETVGVPAASLPCDCCPAEGGAPVCLSACRWTLPAPGEPVSSPGPR